LWAYATAGMSVVPEAGCEHGLELHLLSPEQHRGHTELLAAITAAERALKKELGLEALEALFEANRFDYSDPFRSCLAE
jgi:hypothetical protein